MGDRKIFTTPPYVEDQFIAKCYSGDPYVTVQPQPGGGHKIVSSNSRSGDGGPYQPQTRFHFTETEQAIRNSIAKCLACASNPQGGCVFGKKT